MGFNLILMIGILKVGHGNIRSLTNILEQLGMSPKLVSSKNEIPFLDKLIIPGVGSFNSAMNDLKNKDLIESIRKHSESKDILGICIGMQLMMNTGDEGGKANGIGLIDGIVEKLPINLGRLPHIGWNEINADDNCILMDKVQSKSNVYFVHSYHCEINESIPRIYSNFHGYNFVAGFQKNNIFGTQFHPEKSQNVGIQIIKNFLQK